MPSDYDRIAAAIRFLEENRQDQPGLDELARALNLSTFHFQRLFKRWAGVSPKRFLQFLTVDYARQLLRDSHSVLDTAFATGLSGPGRLHDLFATLEAVTPGEYKALGRGLRIAYGFHPSPFGDSLIAMTDRGVCALAFLEHDGREASLDTLRRQWPEAQLTLNRRATLPVHRQIFTPFTQNNSKPLRLAVCGTNFQIKVWEALLRLPPGYACTYQDIARWIGQPAAARAVGSAVAANPVACLIPCHRVIRKSGLIGGYHWGALRKKAILAWEGARKQPAPPIS